MGRFKSMDGTAARALDKHHSHACDAAQLVPLKRLRVLVAEDNEINRKIARRFIELSGHEVVAVEDGAAAVAACNKERFDAVFLDIQMPVMDGLAAAREIRRQQACQRPVWIIALTAHAAEGDRERCLAAGMDDYLAKPFDLQSLQQKLALVGWDNT